MRMTSIAFSTLAVCAVISTVACKRIASTAGAASGSASRALASRGTPQPAPETAPTSAPENTFAAQFDRTQQVLGAFQHSDAVRSCWQGALMRDPAHVPETLRVQLSVDANGRAQISVNGANDPSLANCIRLRASGRSYGAGGEVATEAVINLAPGG